MVQTESNDVAVILVLNATTEATAAHDVLAFCPQFEGKHLAYKFTPICLAPLKRPEAASLIAELVELARDGPLTLIYSAKDTEHNQAVVLKEFLNSKVNRQQRTHHAREGAA
jgi:Protein of unknown function, DUF488